MSWTPKLGEKVTSPLLVGEWVVFGNTGPDEARLTVMGDACTVVYRLGQRGMIAVPTADLSPVAPPLPPEPPVGSVVWAKGRMWMNGGPAEWHSPSDDPGGWAYAEWPDLAADASPVVAVSQVADWLNGRAGFESSSLAERFVERFGWPDE